MLMFLEICLTVIAWKRGWRGWALLPPVIIFGIAFFATMLFCVINGPQELPFAFEILIDVVYIVTLVVMIARPRRKAKPAVVSDQSAMSPELPVPFAVQAETGSDPNKQNFIRRN